MTNEDQIEQVDNIVDVLKELKDDNTIPKNIKIKLDDIINILSEKSDVFLN